MEASFWDHVEELRKVFVRSLLVIGIGIAIALFFYQHIFAILLSPLNNQNSLRRQEVKLERIFNPHSFPVEYSLAHNEISEDPSIIPPGGSILVERTLPTSLLVLGPIEGMLTTFKMAFWLGLVGTSPIWFYFIFSFVSPALESAQKRLFIPFVGLSILFITLGILFSFYLTIPIANQYLRLFNESIGTNQWTLSNYLDYTVILLLANGIAFEFAVILLFLVHYGVINPDSMANKRRHMIVAAFVIGAILTPPDVLTQVMLAVPLILLYEGIIVYGRLRKRFTFRYPRVTQKVTR